MGYYLAMFGWTRLFGTTEMALRLPGALLGTASVWLIYCIGARVWFPAVGALAAVMLALHGFHIQWSQNARMYVPAAFLALLATWFLLAVADSSRRRRWRGCCSPPSGAAWPCRSTGARRLRSYWSRPRGRRRWSRRSAAPTRSPTCSRWR